MGKLAYLDTFITEATTSVVVETFLTKRQVSRLTTAKKALIEPGEVLSSDGNTLRERFKVKLQFDTEANITAAINDIIDATIAYSKRAAGFTYPATMYHIKFAYTNKAFIQNGIWKQDIFIDVEWGTS